jgi:hypothetical protein
MKGIAMKHVRATLRRFHIWLCPWAFGGRLVFLVMGRALNYLEREYYSWPSVQARGFLLAEQQEALDILRDAWEKAPRKWVQL